MNDLTAWLRERRAELMARRWRGVTWIAEDAEAGVAKAARWVAAGDWRAPLWIGPELAEVPSGVSRLTASRVRSRLGSEHDLVVFDAVSVEAGFDPDAFGAISGSVVAGGWLLLLTPRHWRASLFLSDVTRWRPDADYRRLAHWPHAPDSLAARYLQRLAMRLGQASHVAHWSGDIELPSMPAFSIFEPGTTNVALDDPDCLTRDQAEAVQRLVRLRRRRPVVLIADRGRGKSAALGIAAARRLQRGESRLWVTSSSREAVEALFERLAALLPAGRREAERFEVVLEGRDCRVEWLAPERVIPALAAADIDARSPPTLFIDEAASIPAARLVSWLRQFPRIAFATTVHGYEGTGRGFEVRLRDALDRLTPEWKRLTLQTPIRWGANDPLEALTRELLCLDAEISAPQALASAVAENAVCHAWLDRAALARDETLLNQAFGLLVQAHYRTAPSDLRQLLDGPDLRLLAAMAGDTLVGLCVVQQEGGFDAELAADIQLGRRRPRGHLLAQSLAMHGGHIEAATARWWRIMRIAVHPALRRRGVGGRLVAGVAEEAGKAAIDRLGVSFGAEPGLMRFWRGQGFHTLRLGLTREAASGEPAMMMGRGLTPAARADLGDLTRDFETLLPDLLAEELDDIEPLVAAGWLHEGAILEPDDETWARLAWFAAGGGELALVRPWLRQAWLAWWRRQPLAALPTAIEADVIPAPAEGGPGSASAIAAWVAALFQRHDAALARGGRRDRQAVARALVRHLLEDAGGLGHAPNMVKSRPDE
ncbi:tRNA(Met) cytidine acetyltransferase TmcA [Salinicola peritrichatus]|uniref:tRNA(Met) cytidine acetyltransferase TmcA n=1 Tax=Salinicola peritrichatus TaxID=1267424 RepID=UPI000DA1C933|nr:GNAT family N-acetyltransferase [Salinicola peritrichatus]